MGKGRPVPATVVALFVGTRLRRLPAHLPSACRAPLCRAASPAVPAQLFQLQPYTPPSWAAKLPHIPQQRYRLAQLPTPIHRWAVPGVLPGCELWIKRDDLTGMQLSGNKVGGRVAASRSTHQQLWPTGQ